MPDTPSSSFSAGPSPPKPLANSPSIFGYQARLLQRTSSTTTNHRNTPVSTSSGALHSLAALANSPTPNGPSPPSTPITRSVKRMVAESNGAGLPAGQRNAPAVVGLGIQGSQDKPAPALGHTRGSKSISSVRDQWQAKINGLESPGPESVHVTPRSTKRHTFSPDLTSGLGFASSNPSSSFAAVAPAAPMQPDRTGTSVVTNASQNSGISSGASGRYQSAYMAARASKRSTNMATSTEPISPAMPPPAAPTVSSTVATDDGSELRQRPASISSYTSVLSPHSTGESSIASGRTAAQEEKLAAARANALRRLEARRKAQAEAAGESAPSESSSSVLSTRSASPSPEDIATIKPTAPITPLKAKEAKPSPFANLFEPPSVTPSTPLDKTPKRAIIGDLEATPTSRGSRMSEAPSSSSSRPSVLSRYVPSGLSTQPKISSVSSGTLAPPSGGKDKYGSISKSDRRRLGKHLPRIASGGEGWDGDEVGGHGREPSGRRVPSSLGRNSTAPVGTENTPPPQPVPAVTAKFEKPSSPTTPSSRPRAIDVLAPSLTANQSTPTSAPSARTTSTAPTPSKRRSVHVTGVLKEQLGSPRPEVAGEEMKGLMSAVGALGIRGSARDGGEGVTGMASRFRLSKSSLPPSASSAALAPAPLPSRRLAQTNWMDRQRHALAAYEYLCHVGEAQQWIEGCLDEELDFGVTELEEGLRDGVVLAKLARTFLGTDVVKNIYSDGKHRYKQTENINYFLRLLRSVGMPETFIFEVTDLYNKRNIPKVIFCLHVLSHLLARMGKAQRIGNLVGQFEFTDEQLAATQKGLQGVAMPNFGDARNTLAKEASWEPEEPEETEDEKRDRLLLECEPSIISLQSVARGRMARASLSRSKRQLDLARPVIVSVQAQIRGRLVRKALSTERHERSKLSAWSTRLQAAARGHLTAEQTRMKVQAIRSSERSIVALQAQVRGLLARVRLSKTQNGLDKSSRYIVGFQAACRGHLARRHRKTQRQALSTPQVAQTVTSFQAVLRGRLHRQEAKRHEQVLTAQTAVYTSLQSQLRGAMVRRKHRAREEKLDNAVDYIVAIQSTARGVLARRRKQLFTKVAQQTSPAIISLQSLARARLAKQSHRSMQKALAKVEVAGSVGGLQAFLRTKLAKRQATEQKKQLEFVQPDVIGFQAVARGYLARQEYREWRDYLYDPHTQGALVFLQSLIRGYNARRRLYLRTSYIHANIDKVVKIQALWRGRTERQMYRKLLTGQDVDVPTIQNYMHLLDDTEADFRDQIHTDNLRTKVMELIRENQSMETEVKELDTKIALIVNNKMTFEELARAKRRAGGGHAEQTFHQVNLDPFAGGAHLDKTTQRKLELFEHLFFTLQTQQEYLCRLLMGLSASQEGDVEKDRRLVESVMLVLFGYERREEYLFHKLLQLSCHQEILYAPSLAGLAESRFAILGAARQYAKPALTPYLQEVMTGHILRVVQAPDADLSTDPLEIYLRSINAEESRTGLPSSRPRDLNADQVLQTDAQARAEYIQHLQELRYSCDQLIKGLVRSTAIVPYTIRLLARETLLALRIKFPDAEDHELTSVVARAVVLPFLLPALIAPETYGICDKIGPVERRNLASISTLLTQVAAPNMPGAPKDRFIRVPLAEYINADSKVFSDWVLELAEVEPLEENFQTHGLFESSMEAKPISITRTEIYGMLSVLIRNAGIITAGKTADPVARVLEELEGPPLDFDKSKTPVSLRLTNRLAQFQPEEDVPGKEDWVQAKRHVLAVLRVQTGRTLYDVLVATPRAYDEQRWIEEVHRDIAMEQARLGAHQLPPTPVEKEYQIESIRSLAFHEVKSRAIEFCMRLEAIGRVSRENHFVDLLISIAGDIRQKHHLRKMQKQSLVAMVRAHDDLSAKRKKFEEQIKSYHDYIDSSMASLQAKGKKKPTFLSKQYRHQRHEAKLGKRSQFGSYAYTATELYDRGILLGISQFSPRQYDKVTIVIASNEVGVFSIEMAHVASAAPSSLIGHEEIRMEDLLQAQFDNEQSLVLFEGMATFSINLLIHQINKKFYS